MADWSWNWSWGWVNTIAPVTHNIWHMRHIWHNIQHIWHIWHNIWRHISHIWQNIWLHAHYSCASSIPFVIQYLTKWNGSTWRYLSAGQKGVGAKQLVTHLHRSSGLFSSCKALHKSYFSTLRLFSCPSQLARAQGWAGKAFWLPGTGREIENHIPVLREGNGKGKEGKFEACNPGNPGKSRKSYKKQD